MDKEEIKDAIIIHLYQTDELFKIMVQKYMTIHSLGMVLGKEYMRVILNTLIMLEDKLQGEFDGRTKSEEESTLRTTKDCSKES